MALIASIPVPPNNAESRIRYALDKFVRSVLVVVAHPYGSPQRNRRPFDQSAGCQWDIEIGIRNDQIKNLAWAITQSACGYLPPGTPYEILVSGPGIALDPYSEIGFVAWKAGPKIHGPYFA